MKYLCFFSCVLYSVHLFCRCHYNCFAISSDYSRHYSTTGRTSSIQSSCDGTYSFSEQILLYVIDARDRVPRGVRGLDVFHIDATSSIFFSLFRHVWNCQVIDNWVVWTNTIINKSWNDLQTSHTGLHWGQHVAACIESWTRTRDFREDNIYGKSTSSSFRVSIQCIIAQLLVSHIMSPFFKKYIMFFITVFVYISITDQLFILIFL